MTPDDLRAQFAKELAALGSERACLENTVRSLTQHIGSHDAMYCSQVISGLCVLAMKHFGARRQDLHDLVDVIAEACESGALETFIAMMTPPGDPSLN